MKKINGIFFPEPNPGMFMLQVAHCNRYNKTAPRYWLSVKLCLWSAYIMHGFSVSRISAHADEGNFVHSSSLQTVYRVHYNIKIILTMPIVMLAAG